MGSYLLREPVGRPPRFCKRFDGSAHGDPGDRKSEKKWTAFNRPWKEIMTSKSTYFPSEFDCHQIDVCVNLDKISRARVALKVSILYRK